jgi:(1->4)-alpha-D-glucan 1-alpha-D-glucosylmutase
LPPDEFHRANAERARDWPHAMVATATHDTKRGEDARARLAALTEMPDAWEEALATWREVVGPTLPEIRGEPAPDPNDQFLILQGLLGAWPLELLDRDEGEALESFRERFQGFVEKALREAKRHTSWVNPNAAYEAACRELVDAILTPGSAGLAALRPLANRLARAGMLNGLARTVLKFTVPGVPDTYQGTAFWDFSLVDPDNRRPVEAELLRGALADESEIGTLLADWADGRIKQRLIARLLADRAASPGLYADGDYRRARASGEHAARIVAFSREAGGEVLLSVAPRLASGLADGDVAPLGRAWGETRIAVAPGRWRDVLTGTEHESRDGDLAVRELFAALPVSVLRRTG